MMERRARKRAITTLVSLAAAASAIACVEITVDTKQLGSVEVVNRGVPALVAGDTVRDSAGKAIPLEVRAYTAGGDLMSGRTVKYVVLDTGIVQVSATGYVTAHKDTSGSGRLYAVVDDKLQSILQNFTIVFPPDSAALSGRAADSVKYRALLNGAYDSSTVLGVKILSGTKLVPRWIVKFALRKAGDTTTIKDTTRYALVLDNSRRVSYVDTSDISGAIASRRLRVVTPFGITTTDTLEVVIRATYKGLDLKGSPRVIPVIVKPGT